MPWTTPTFKNAANVEQPVDVTNGLPISSIGYSSSASKTRPNDTTAYAALDVIAESNVAGTVWTFSNIAPSGGGKILIDSVTMEVDVAAIPSGMIGFRLHLYNAAPTALNDNDAFNLPAGDRAKYLGFVELPTPLDLGATLWSETEGMAFPVRKQVVAASSTLSGTLQTLGAFTPTANAVKTITIHSVGV